MRWRTARTTRHSEHRISCRTRDYGQTSSSSDPPSCLDTAEVTGSIPVAPTQRIPCKCGDLLRQAPFWVLLSGVSCAHFEHIRLAPRWVEGVGGVSVETLRRLSKDFEDCLDAGVSKSDWSGSAHPPKTKTNNTANRTGSHDQAPDAQYHTVPGPRIAAHIGTYGRPGLTEMDCQQRQSSTPNLLLPSSPVRMW